MNEIFNFIFVREKKKIIMTSISRKIKSKNLPKINKLLYSFKRDDESKRQKKKKKKETPRSEVLLQKLFLLIQAGDASSVGDFLAMHSHEMDLDLRLVTFLNETSEKIQKQRKFFFQRKDDSLGRTDVLNLTALQFAVIFGH